MNKRIAELIRKYEETVLKHYHWLHMHPELSGQEKETAAYIASLEALNQKLSLLASAVVEMKEGCAHWEKGKPNIITAYGSTG